MRQQELKVHYYLKRNETKTDGTTPLLGRITIGKSMIQFSSKVSVNPKIWDIKSGRALGKSKQATTTNSELDRLNVAIHSKYKELLTQKEHVSVDDVKFAFQGVISENETLLNFFNQYINEVLSKRVGVNLTLESFKRYFIAMKHLRGFISDKYNLADIPLHRLDCSFIEQYDFYLRVHKKLKKGTVIGTIGLLKIVVKRAVRDEVIIRYPFMGFTIKPDPIEPKTLTNEELELIMTTPIDTFNRSMIRDIFLFSVFTGISFSDIRNLTTRNIIKLEDGTKCIKSKRRKTGVEFTVPLMPLPLKIIDKYRGMGAKGKLFRMMSCNQTNANLKKITQMCGIQRNITFHVGRHSYASLITLSQGVPMETVSRMLGHSDMRATRIYAHISNEKIENDMKALNSCISEKYCLNN